MKYTSYLIFSLLILTFTSTAQEENNSINIRSCSSDNVTYYIEGKKVTNKDTVVCYLNCEIRSYIRPEKKSPLYDKLRQRKDDLIDLRFLNGHTQKLHTLTYMEDGSSVEKMIQRKENLNASLYPTDYSDEWKRTYNERLNKFGLVLYSSPTQLRYYKLQIVCNE